MRSEIMSLCLMAAKFDRMKHTPDASGRRNRSRVMFPFFPLAA